MSDTVKKYGGMVAICLALIGQQTIYFNAVIKGREKHDESVIKAIDNNTKVMQEFTKELILHRAKSVRYK